MGSHASPENAALRDEVLQLSRTMSPLAIAQRLKIDVKLVHEIKRKLVEAGKMCSPEQDRCVYSTGIINACRKEWGTARFRVKERHRLEVDGKQKSIAGHHFTIESMAKRFGFIPALPDFREDV